MRDRLTMARRVRGYVVAGRPSSSTAGGPAATGRANTRERKALATLGRKGGKKAAQRWADRDSDYARGRLEVMEQTHRRKRVQGQTSRARIQALIGQQYAELGTVPTRAEIMAETGLSRATVTRHLAAIREAGLLP